MGRRTGESSGRHLQEGRKVIEAVGRRTGTIEIWGDGQQSRSFMYIDDCLEGTQRIMSSDIEYPINLGSEELVTINQLIDLVEEFAGTRLQRVYLPDAPKGVHSRNSDNTRLRREVGWEPGTTLREGMAWTYAWVLQQYHARRHHGELETSGGNNSSVPE